MRHEVITVADAHAVAVAAADHIASAARRAVQQAGSFSIAVSGGHTPWKMFAELTTLDVPWEQVTVFQVDERIAPADDADRNLAHLEYSLSGVAATIVPMEVEDPDPDAAAARYAELLPERFDLVHLGLGPDGHTASLVPGDAVLDVTDRLVAPTAGEYQGRRRMTLTYPGLARAERLLWLVSGGSKQDALARLLAGDTSIPAGRVEAPSSLVMSDRQARGRET